MKSFDITVHNNHGRDTIEHPILDDDIVFEEEFPCLPLGLTNFPHHSSSSHFQPPSFDSVRLFESYLILALCKGLANIDTTSIIALYERDFIHIC